MPKLRLARATPADSAAIARLHHASHTSSFRAFAPRAWTASRRLEAYEADWRARLAAAESAAWLAFVGCEHAGIVGANPLAGDDTAQPRRLAAIRALHVLPRWQRRGVASALWEAAVAFLLERGFRIGRSDTIEANLRIRAFIEARGGRVVARAATGVEGVPIVTYEYELARFAG